jgi:hypothetical protein
LFLMDGSASSLVATRALTASALSFVAIKRIELILY